MTDKKPRVPALSYIGPEFLTGIPARDLSPADLEQLVAKPKRRLAKSAAGLADVLIATNLYAVKTDEKE
jgi:hypothetical protein